MLRRILAAASLIVIAVALLVTAWPQLFSVSRASVIAQLVSLRAAALVVALIAMALLGLIVIMSPLMRRFAASCVVLLLAFSAVNVAVLATRGFGNMAFETASANSVTVLTWNTLGDAPGADAIAQLALETGADIIALPETTEATGQAVAASMEFGGKRMQSFTLAFDLISKARSTTLLISEDLGEYAVDAARPNSNVLPSVVATPVDGSGPTIISVHLVAPIPGEMGNWRSDLEWLATACGGENVIMAGDFNSTIDHFSGLATEEGAALGNCFDSGGLTDNAAVGTWPTALPPLLGAPIDHVMQTANWRVSGMRVIADHDTRGSDHRPVLVQLVPAG